MEGRFFHFEVTTQVSLRRILLIYAVIMVRKKNNVIYGDSHMIIFKTDITPTIEQITSLYSKANLNRPKDK
jgi:hypothetical protein